MAHSNACQAPRGYRWPNDPQLDLSNVGLFVTTYFGVITITPPEGGAIVRVEMTSNC